MRSKQTVAPRRPIKTSNHKGFKRLSTLTGVYWRDINVGFIATNQTILVVGGGRVSQLYKYFPTLCLPSCGIEINLRRMKAKQLEEIASK